MDFTTSITGPIAVIGDVHGHTRRLQGLLDQIKRLKDYDRRWIVFIGDLVDRGPDPKGAIDLVLQLKAEHPLTTAIAGNHELAMSAAVRRVPTTPDSTWPHRWLDHYGARPTFESYGVPFGDLSRLAATLPEEHGRYLSDLPWCVDHPEYFFVHAGLEPHSPFSVQRSILQARDFTLSRPQWLCSKNLTIGPEGQPATVPADCHQTVVSGHVRVPSVLMTRKRILIDTSGGEADGVLSCVLLPEMEILYSS
ncbi:metallophosphoesterase [Planctomyces sp. SH-PL14]|uniref:metallophosphoesterase n=1 Tax=Planctomyces sp. SH-PL14 TaxID=1632864 RepID=UPI00078CA8BF|nr:metallophosphoesterase [Planctomyces sp. SH-PL14]AMV22684.1 diadenosine tetraphosphatase [Planctomyces sp. SH-PL14]